MYLVNTKLLSFIQQKPRNKIMTYVMHYDFKNSN